MDAEAFRWLGLITIVVAIAGCPKSRPADGERPSAATEAASKPSQPPPVFYGDTGLPSERAPVLSDRELTRVMDKTATTTRDPIWFIRVIPYVNFHENIVERGTVVVYLVPERQTPRIRAGRAYEITLRDQETGISSVLDYLQISRPDQAFPRELTLPLAADLPFSRPDIIDPNTRRGPPVSEDELVRIVDFARQPSVYQRLAGQRLSPEEAQRMPLIRVNRFRGAVISITFGFVYDPGSGHGMQVMIKSTPDGYELVNCGEWTS